MQANPKRQPKFLFKDYNLYNRRPKLRRYVKEVLVEKALANELCVTDLLLHPNKPIHFRDLIGEVICGVEVVDEGQQQADIPEELRNYKVRLKPYGNYKTVKWKKGRYAKDSFFDDGEQVRLYDDVYAELEPGKDGTVTVSLYDAWCALQQYGKDVAYATKPSQREMNWRLEEVRPAAAARA